MNLLVFICERIARMHANFGRFWRRFYYSHLFRSCGDRLVVQTGAEISHPQNIVAGHGVVLNKYCVLDGKGGITLGNHVAVSFHAIIVTGGIQVEPGTGRLIHSREPVTIGNNVWIGAGTIILPGVRIPDNVQIGAGAIITKDLESGYVYVGNPARALKAIPPELLEAIKRGY